MTDLSVKEQELKKELSVLLTNHRNAKYSAEDKHASVSVTMDRLSKALKNTGVPEKKVLVLEQLISLVEFKIDQGVTNYEMLCALPSITYDKLRKYSKTSKEELGRLLEREELKREGKQAKRVPSSELVENILDRCFASLKDLDRAKMEKLDDFYTEELKKVVADFDEKKASGEIMGCLNRGMFGKIKKQLVEEFNEKYRLNISNNYKLSDKMSDELYRYRLAALYATVEMCSKRKDGIKKDKRSTFNKYAYLNLKKLVFAIGGLVREKYFELSGMYPKDELIYNLNRQLTIEGIIPERDKWNETHIK